MSTNANWYGQQFFFDGTFGVLRYLHDSQFNSNVYSFTPGVNWKLTSRCSGSLAGFFTRSPSTLTELVGTGVNYATTTSVNETGKCAISNGFSVLFNSGVTNTTNSNPVDAVNNANVEMISAGIEYAKGEASLNVLASKSDTNYANRGAGAEHRRTGEHRCLSHLHGSYTRQINANLSVTGPVGLVGVTNAFTLGLPKTLLPTYSIDGPWTVTPKVRLGVSASRVVTPPTTVIANAEMSYKTILSLSYQRRPRSPSAPPERPATRARPSRRGWSARPSRPSLANTNYYSANAGVTYAMTPFISAALSATFSERVSDHVFTPQDLITVSLNYRPY